MNVARKIKSIVNDKINEFIEMENGNRIASAVNNETFSRFKNYCKGEKDVVLCGAGPTAKEYQMIPNAIHIAVNRAFMIKDVDFDFIFAQDFDGIRMVQNELIEYSKHENCTVLLGHQYSKRKQIPESLSIKCNASRFYTDEYIYKNGYKSKLVYEIDKCAIGNMPNVGISAMQFALFLNPKAIHIVGMDMSGGHFTNASMTKTEIKEQEKLLKETWDNNLLELRKRWNDVKEFAEVYYPETKIDVIRPVGLKGIFEEYDCFRNE